jgi:hypothetical protein
MFQCTLTDEEKSGSGLMPFENVENLRGMDRVGAVIERERHKWPIGACAVDNIRREPLNQAEDAQRFDPEDDESCRQQGRSQN